MEDLLPHKFVEDGREIMANIAKVIRNQIISMPFNDFNPNVKMHCPDENDH